MHPETIIQQSIHKYLTIVGVPHYSVPNEGVGGASQAYKRVRLLQSMGMLSGVSDLVLLFDRETVYVEVKTATGRLSASQKDFKKLCDETGRPYYVVRSLDEVIEIVNKYKK